MKPTKSSRIGLLVDPGKNLFTLSLGMNRLFDVAWNAFRSGLFGDVAAWVD